MEPRTDRSLFVAGLLFTVVLHAGILALLLLTRARAEEGPKLIGAFVDAQLVRFGKPRDLTFLPHKQGVIKDNIKPDAIKVATDAKALPHLDDKKQPEQKFDPLKKTHAEMFKNMQQDQPEGYQDVGEGSPTGSHAGTATEARGDPYILSLIDQIGSSWSVPTTIKDAELAKLSAGVCLDIAEDGTLRGYKFLQKSGNSQFDSSLDAALSQIKKVPAPPEKWKSLASRGKLCPEFIKQ